MRVDINFDKCSGYPEPDVECIYSPTRLELYVVVFLRQKLAGESAYFSLTERILKGFISSNAQTLTHTNTHTVVKQSTQCTKVKHPPYKVGIIKESILVARVEASYLKILRGSLAKNLEVIFHLSCLSSVKF